MLYKYFVAIAVSYIVFIAGVFAQDSYVFQHLTVEDGLLANPRVNVFQDSEGFYWFASVSGIQRYDGQNFINYKYQYSAGKTINDDWAGKPIEDNEKNIWIVNAEGVNIFLREKRILTRLYMIDAIDSNTNNVASVIKDVQNTIWIITSKNIFRYDYTTRKAVLFSHIISDKNAGVIKGEYDGRRKVLWLLIRNKSTAIACFHFNKMQLQYPLHRSLDQVLGHNNPIAFFKLDEDSDLWIANYYGDFCRYNISNGKIFSYSVLHKRNKGKVTSPNSTISDCIDDKNGSIWFGGDYYLGLLRYDKKTGAFSEIKNDNGSEYALHYDEKIYSFYEDRDHDIWLNTDVGMNIFNPGMQQFKYLNKNTAQTVSQFSSDVSSFFQSTSGDVWVSTWGDGIFKYDSNFAFRANYIHHNNNFSSLGEPLNRTWCFSEDPKGRIWIGCQQGIVSVLDTVSGRFINKTSAGFKKRTVMYMVKDRNNNIWMGLFDGMLAKWDAAANNFFFYENLYGSDSKEFLIMHGLCQDNKDNIWISTSSHGLNRFDEEKGKITETAFSSQNILSSGVLNDSVIIVCTSGKGLFLFNKFTKKVLSFNTTNGLSSNFIFGATPGTQNTLWIFANNGIEKLDLRNAKISNYNLNDGIRDHVLEGPFCKLKNGMIMVAAKSGIIYFNPCSIKDKSSPPPVFITAFYAAETSYPVDSLLNKPGINLPYNENAVTIEYASLSFTGRKTDKYFYQLDGVNKYWVPAGTRRFVAYANLSPGNYIFKVKSQNSDGLETKNITILRIIIHPPWWQTWWAYIGWFALAGWLLFLVYGYRKSNRAALSVMRQRIATDLHDDIGSTLNSISVYSEVASQQIESNAKNAKILLHKMGVASRNMIDTMNDIVWAINPKNDQFENVLQRMQYFAGELLSAKNILLQFKADESVRNVKLSMDKRKNFYLIFKEAVNNAYKYSHSKAVTVTIAMEAQKLVMIIMDSGNGFEVSEKTLGGNGLKNMQTRARETGAQLQITSGPGMGTKIELRLPVK